MPTVSIPNVGDVQFPDSMSPADIEAKAREIHQNRTRQLSPQDIFTPERLAGATMSQSPTGAPQPAPMIDRLDPTTMAKTAVAPTIGTLVGGLIGRKGGAPGAMAGEAIGAGLGEVYNQATGQTDFNPLAILEAPIGAVTGRIAGGGMNAGREFIPGTRRAAENLNLLGRDEALRVVQGFKPTGPTAKDLFAQARAQNVTIPASRTIQAIDGALNELQKSPETADMARGLKHHLETLRTEIQTLGPAGRMGGLNPDEIQAKLNGISDRIDSISGERTKNLARLGVTVKDAILDDLDTAATTANPAMPAARTLQMARDTFLREQSVKDLEGYIGDAMKTKRGQGGVEQFNANAVIEKIKKDRYFTKALSPDEQKDAINTLKLMDRMPVLPPGEGAMFGSGRDAARMLIPMVGGAAIGGYQGGPIGALAGVAASTTGTLARNLSLAWHTQGGRELIKKLVMGAQASGQPAWTPQMTAILGAAVGSQAEAAKQVME